MKDADAEIIDVDYISELRNGKNGSGRHFSDGFITDINNKLGINIKKNDMYPSIYLTEEEKNEDIRKKYNLPERYWLFNAGIKIDIPLKSWVIDYWKEVIFYSRMTNIKLVQIGSHKDIHPEFDDSVISLIGKTEDLREFLKVCYHAEGSIGPISMHMHIMAAFKKPCVVIAGGRETPTWEQYPIHQFFHTVGVLDCCKLGGCWKSQRNECININNFTDYPECMTLIYPPQVMKAIRNYITYRN
jgi:ADP-heptose:LPS heptosyltransferase